ncbi:MAG: hypothetical protein JW737_07985 [Acidobacteria bacterium]|nr:hypothetical protein [Acidobacteriota bacterium]
MSKIVSGLLKSIWLIPGLIFLYLIGGDRPVSIALWLAPVFFIRYFRETGRIIGPIVALPFITAISVVSNIGILPIPLNIAVIYFFKSTIIAIIPYILDRNLRSYLSMGLRTLLFPASIVALLFYQSSIGPGMWVSNIHIVDDINLLQIVSLSGVWGLVFFVSWIASLLNELWEHRENFPSVRRLVVVSIVIITVVYGFGVIRIRISHEPMQRINIGSVVPRPAEAQAAVQNIQGLLGLDETNNETRLALRAKIKAHFSNLIARSERLASAGSEIVIWSEAAALILLDDSEECLETAMQSARKYKYYLGLSVGLQRDKIHRDRNGFRPFIDNMLILISPEGEVLWEYSKSKITPGLEKMVMIPGEGKMRLADTGRVTVTGAICYEMDFPDLIRQSGVMDADLLLAPSNDWPEIKNRHATMTRMRAIENGVTIFRPTGSGISVVYDAYGRQLVKVDYFQSGGASLIYPVCSESVNTLYSKFGDYIAWFCIFFATILSATGILRVIIEKDKKTIS